MMNDSHGETSLDTLFSQMEEQDPGSEGYYQRRVPALNPCDIYVGVRKPANLRLVRFSFSADALPEDYELPSFRVLRVTRATEPSASLPRESITLQADQAGFNEVFTHLVQDIIARAARETSEAGAAHVLRARLILWQRLLQRDRTNGLTPEEQRGLYGELHTLETLLLPRLGPLATVQAWTGPLGTPQDFQIPGAIALEVKTSLTRSASDINISSEVQLDDSGSANLYLKHILIEAQRDAGESLPALVARVRNILITADPAATDIFEDLLLEAGYSPTSNPEVLYREPGYTFRGARMYRVHGDFPRIVRAQLPAGVSNVTYGLSTAALTPFEESFPEFIERLNPVGGTG